MSTLKVTNIQNRSGGNTSTADEIYSGRAKAWVNFNGQGTVAIRASFNVSSITDIATSKYQVNFSNALTDANYSAVSMVAIVSAETDDTPRFMGIRGTTTMTTTSFRVIVGNDVGGLDDPHTACISVFR